jgi:hypothetical protein
MLAPDSPLTCNDTRSYEEGWSLLTRYTYSRSHSGGHESEAMYSPFFYLHL